jgi:hypothetical protein
VEERIQHVGSLAGTEGRRDKRTKRGIVGNRIIRVKSNFFFVFRFSFFFFCFNDR